MATDATPSGTDSLGPVVGLFVAPGSRLPMQTRYEVVVEDGRGIVGDRYHAARHRQVTVQSVEELDAAAVEHGAPIDPGGTRRNVTLGSGRLDRTPGARMRIGGVLLEVVRDAAPCKLLEDALGRDARLALHRRAGVVCRTLEGGRIVLGDRASRV
ncbi:MAG: MOSC domain-containing protein [Planctomycetota bacterium]